MGNINKRIGTKVGKHASTNEVAASKMEPFPYIGIVKSNFDPIMAGRLKVWIPESGTRETDEKSWRTVSYASPFMGTTDIKDEQSQKASEINSFKNVPHTYGMWMVPPDVGVHVICIFVGGDPNRGYWIACVNPNLSKHMIPGIAGSDRFDISNASNKTNIKPKAGDRPPVAEFNEVGTKNRHELTTKRPIHEYQYYIYKNQGLNQDRIRGAVSSSSQRESPSMVFGISTPGRPNNDPADSKELFGAYINKVNNNNIKREDYVYKTRKGGHTFLLDDGSTTGADQLIRLRTAKGHQIMMHDTAKSLYISHANGESWIELTADGRIKAYAKGGIDLRTEGDMNFDANQNITFNARGEIRMHSKGAFKINSDARTELLSKAGIKIESIDNNVEIKAGQNFVVDVSGTGSIRAVSDVVLAGSRIRKNSGGALTSHSIIPMYINKYDDATLGTNDFWEVNPKALQSIVSAAPPTHEPYARSTDPENKVSVAGLKATDAPDITPDPVYPEDVAKAEQEAAAAEAASKTFSGANYGGGSIGNARAMAAERDAAKEINDKSIKNAATDKDLRNQPKAQAMQVGDFEMSNDEVTAYMAQMSRSESGGDYTVVNSAGYVGKYQMGWGALRDEGLVKSHVTSNAQLQYASSWTKKAGGSREAFLNNKNLQEETMYNYTKRNYKSLVTFGGITAEQTTAERAGMMSAAHLLGACGATTWRLQEVQSRCPDARTIDGLGTTGDTYYKRGVFSQEKLVPKLAAINADSNVG